MFHTVSSIYNIKVHLLFFHDGGFSLPLIMLGFILTYWESCWSFKLTVNVVHYTE